MIKISKIKHNLKLFKLIGNLIKKDWCAIAHNNAPIIVNQ